MITKQRIDTVIGETDNQLTAFMDNSAESAAKLIKELEEIIDETINDDFEFPDEYSEANEILEYIFNQFDTLYISDDLIIEAYYEL